MEDKIWHYAVFKGDFFRQPACLPRDPLDWIGLSGNHGMTIVRGDVTCTDCKRMMGMV